ncbi:hypothetical protein [Kitasatospora sp. NPDC015120]|uniref:hypothetical protein n=1 Tax=Kitasatospora sp. NPDC015120 TaxID=3364023 RepID=UPI0036F478F7
MMRITGRASETPSRFGRAALAAVVATSMLALSACGVETVSERRKATITLDQAKAQVDGYLAEIVAKLPVEPLASRSGDFVDSYCDSNDVGPQGRKQTSRGYGFGDVPLDRRAESAASFRTLLMAKGFETVQEATADWVKLRNPENEFVAVLSGASDDSSDLSLEVSTPCLWPKGTPSP